MTASAGMYTQLTHDRPQDYQIMVDGKVRTVLILQPDASKVWKIWEKIKNHKNPRVILRVWDWDDGRTYEGDTGVYKLLRDIPEEYGKTIAQRFDTLIKDMRNRANQEGRDFPADHQILCHLINEPDTNHYESQICRFTDSAIDERNRIGAKWHWLCFNFGTGHPAKQMAGPGSDPDWRPYRNTIAKINASDDYIGLHEYYNNLRMTDPSIMPWHIYRHKMNSAKEALRDSKVIISEWGLEMLVNNAGPNHHGWNGIITPTAFCADLYYYCSFVADYVDEVLIYANDLPDRVWKTFDTVPAMPDIIAIMNDLWTDMEYAPEPPEPPENPDTELIWPCDGILTQRFGENPDRYIPLGSPAHNGIDIANDPGTLVLSVATGFVEWVDENSGYGKYVRVWHPQLGFHSFYAHLNEQTVSGGQLVLAGQSIGLMGNTGNSTGPHLHFEIRFGERYRYYDVTYGYLKGRANPEAVYASYGMTW